MTTLIIGGVALGAWLLWVRRNPKPFPASMTGLLEHPLRRRIVNPDAIVARLELAPGMRVLEIGPGGGMFAETILRRAPGTSIVCLDVQPSIVRLVRDRLGAARALHVCGDASALPLPDAGLDRILLVAVLGEVPDRGAALRECARVLRPGGFALVAEGLPDPDFMPAERLAREARAAGLVPAERVGHWASYSRVLHRARS